MGCAVPMCQVTVLYHTSKIYIYLIESPPAFKRILFQFFYILILIRQKVYKTLLFLKNSCDVQDARLKFLEKRGKMNSHFHGNDIRGSGNDRIRKRGIGFKIAVSIKNKIKNTKMH